MNRNTLVLATAIVLAGLLISGAVMYSLGKKSASQGEDKGAVTTQKSSQPTSSVDNVRPVTSNDHILGNPDAPIIIIEYSDTECPFCKQFHSEIHKIVSDYTGQVAWVYRHFPLYQIHPKAIPEAEATECAAELGGNNAFWAYLDRIFEITPSNNNLNLALLPEIAKYVGLDQDAFQKCLDERRYAERVADDYNNAVESGGRATPYSIIISKDGKKDRLNGSLPYSSVKSVLDTLLQ